MNKYKKILIFLLLLLIFPRNIYGYTVKKISNISNAPRIQGKRTIYITNMNDHAVTINSGSFYYDGANIWLTERLSQSKNYENPFSIVFKKAGYYIDNNGNTVYVNVVLNIDYLYLYLPQNYSWRVGAYLIVSFDSNYFWYQVFPYDTNWKSISLGTKAMGNHSKMTFKVTKTDGSDLDSTIASNMMIPWYMWDLDVPDNTSGGSYAKGKTYRESIKFISGFDNTTYVRNNTKLEITESNSKYISTTYTGGSGQPASDYSTVVAYQTNPKAVVEWWGSNCGTAFQIRASSFDYPYMPNMTKSASSTKAYKVGDTVTYVIKQKFPYTIDSNKAKSIELVDEFDSALDISKISFTVKKGSTNDTSNWTMTKKNQTVTLKYNKTSFTSVTGDYTFTFTGIKVKLPDNSHKKVSIKDIK